MKINKYEDISQIDKEAKKDYVAYMYEDVNHGFHNNTTPRYDKDSASLAWNITMEFFKKELN